MKEFIKEKLLELYSSCTTDSWGQVGMFNHRPSIFGDRANEVMEYCKDRKLLSFSTYGGAYGTYKAFTIQDQELRKMCYEALRRNTNYIHNMTRV